jgi:hypothetical protein
MYLDFLFSIFSLPWIPPFDFPLLCYLAWDVDEEAAEHQKDISVESDCNTVGLPHNVFDTNKMKSYLSFRQVKCICIP